MARSPGCGSVPRSRERSSRSRRRQTKPPSDHRVRRVAIHAGALLLAATVCSGAAPPAVTLRLEAVEGSAVRRGVATAVLEVPAERLFEAMADVAHWTEFMPFLVRSAPDPRHATDVWQQRLDLPAPASDRHYSVRVDARRTERGR